MLRKAFLIWCLIILAETFHGIARTLFLQPLVGDFRARQIAVLTGSAIILTMGLACSRWLGEHKPRRLLATGLFWVALTLVFEIGLGRWALGYSWARLAADYNLLEGGLLGLGMILLALTPLLAAKIRGTAKPGATDSGQSGQ